MNDRLKNLNNKSNPNGKCIVYVMSRDQRVSDNFALLYAQQRSIEEEIPLVVYFNLYPQVKNRIYQHYQFMIDGLIEVQEDLKDKNIDLILGVGSVVENIKELQDQINPKEIIFDFSPLRGPIETKKKIAEASNVKCTLICTHNTIPPWVVSYKEEFAAYTFRPKIYTQLAKYLKEPEKLIKSKFDFKQNLKSPFLQNLNSKKWNEVLDSLKLEKLDNYNPIVKPGEKEAKKVLQDFLENKLKFYSDKRNDPSKDAQSNLSAYIHFGHISALRIVLEVQKYVQSQGFDIEFNKRMNKSAREVKNPSLKVSAEAFVEEMVVRRELAENFCLYNKHYDSIQGLRDWAKVTLRKHEKDKREHIYTLKELEEAKTYDDAWNAAQMEANSKGKIHGYMRMYWGKKLLEWTENADDAIKFAIYLNDKYELDGYNPNGYVGILWSIGGLHDRVWFEREIFGTIRYMNYEGLKRKFKLKEYIASV